MYYKKKKRNEIDFCNICGKKTKLTWDHVPPKSVKIGSCAYANKLFSGEMPSETKYEKEFQNGVKYRTICQKCNGDILGKYDKRYAEFTNSLSKVIENKEREISKGKQINPVTEEVAVTIQINKVLRSIVGHFLAMKTCYDKETIIDEYLRQYINDESLELSKVKLYTWFYPYRTIMNLRDVAIRGNINTGDFRIHPRGIISIMCFYPLAYMISTEDEDGCCFDDIGNYSTSNINEEVTITLHMSTAYHPVHLTATDGLTTMVKMREFLWPVNISADDFGAMFVLGNDQMINGSTMAIQK